MPKKNSLRVSSQSEKTSVFRFTLIYFNMFDYDRTKITIERVATILSLCQCTHTHRKGVKMVPQLDSAIRATVEHFCGRKKYF